MCLTMKYIPSCLPWWAELVAEMGRVGFIMGRVGISGWYGPSWLVGRVDQIPSKEYFLVQIPIRDLEERLARYQKKCDELEVGNNGFKSQYEQQVNDKKEIVSFLKKQLEQRGEELADLQDRLIGRTEEFISSIYLSFQFTKLRDNSYIGTHGLGGFMKHVIKPPTNLCPPPLPLSNLSYLSLSLTHPFCIIHPPFPYLHLSL